MSTTFVYDGQNHITSMTTPYGATSFQTMEDSNTGNRGLLVTEPTASHQLYAYYADGPYGHIVEGTLGHYRNSYHWDRAQYDAVTPAGKADPLHMGEDDVLKASGKHFLHGPNFGYDGSVSDTVEASGPAGDLTTLRSGIYNFQYQGQGDPIDVGTLKRVTRIIAPTGDGIDITRNDLGRPLTITYRQGNFLNATYVNTYDAAGRYLQTQQGPRGEWTRRYGYHTEYQGDAAHLLATVTDALNQITRYTYDTNLMKLTGITFPSGLIQSNVYYQSGTWKGFPLQQLDVGIATNCFRTIRETSSSRQTRWASLLPTSGIISTALSPPVSRMEPRSRTSIANSTWLRSKIAATVGRITPTTPSASLLASPTPTTPSPFTAIADAARPIPLSAPTPPAA